MDGTELFLHTNFRWKTGDGFASNSTQPNLLRKGNNPPRLAHTTPCVKKRDDILRIYHERTLRGGNSERNDGCEPVQTVWPTDECLRAAGLRSIHIVCAPCPPLPSPPLRPFPLLPPCCFVRPCRPSIGIHSWHYFCVLEGSIAVSR